MAKKKSTMKADKAVYKNGGITYTKESFNNFTRGSAPTPSKKKMGGTKKGC